MSFITYVHIIDWHNLHVDSVFDKYLNNVNESLLQRAAFIREILENGEHQDEYEYIDILNYLCTE